MGDGDSPEEEKVGISISSESVSKTYDGTPLTSTSFTIEGDEYLKKGHKIYAYCNNSITNAGSLENTVDYFILDSNLNDVSDQYDVITDFGTLTVEKKQLQVWTEDCTVSLNKQYENRSINIAGGFINGDSIANIETVTFKTRGTYKNIIIITKIVNKYGDDVTNNYEFTYTYGTLEVI